jgi:hypothetical protein
MGKVPIQPLNFYSYDDIFEKFCNKTKMKKVTMTQSSLFVVMYPDYRSIAMQGSPQQLDRVQGEVLRII